MKRKWVLAKKVGLLIASSSLFWAACQQGASLKLDTKTAKPLPLKKTAKSKDVQLYDTGRAKTEDYSKANDNQAQYVFLFIGDGMGITP